MRASYAFLASVIAVMVISGGLLHAAIPHNDGDNHGTQPESAIWQSLHSALKHDDKKALYIALEVFELIILTTLSLLALSTRFNARWRAVLARAIHHDSSRGEPLRRGIFRYRAFG